MVGSTVILLLGHTVADVFLIDRRPLWVPPGKRWAVFIYISGCPLYAVTVHFTRPLPDQTQLLAGFEQLELNKQKIGLRLAVRTDYVEVSIAHSVKHIPKGCRWYSFYVSVDQPNWRT